MKKESCFCTFHLTGFQCRCGMKPQRCMAPTPSKVLTLIISLFATYQAPAQNYLNKLQRADGAYQHKAFALAGPRYLALVKLATFDLERQGLYFNAACCYALTDHKEEAFRYLARAIRDYGYCGLKRIEGDPDLTSLHHDLRWTRLLARIKPAPRFSGNPRQARLVTTDVQHFWQAYARAQRTAGPDTAQRRQIYRDDYFAKASPGLQDYFTQKIGSIDAFVQAHDKLPRFYAAIRPNTLQVETMKPQMRQSFIHFKALYPAARFPPVYFVIGQFSSGGTASDRGLILGLDQNCRTPNVPTEELTLWQKNNAVNLPALPYTVAHELIHFQQRKQASDTTLLYAALREGMADFLGELISGQVANPRLAIYAKGREPQIWAAFTKEMYLNRVRNWIGNGDQETADHPADLGYWVGYVICKAYYERATNKKQAVYAMLHLKDCRAFLRQSGAAKLLE